MHKFRSMVDNAETLSGPVWAEDEDPRITRVGRIIRKWRFDEIPQLWNVLKGEMSFIGPRPERPEFGAFHTGEMPYVFNNLRLLDRPWEEVDRDLADIVSSYWANFATWGDPNGDGSVNVMDVLAVVNHVLGIEPLNGTALMCADCSGDEVINIIDALGIINVILEIGTCVQ